jgi:hypothetical protein
VFEEDLAAAVDIGLQILAAGLGHVLSTSRGKIVGTGTVDYDDIVTLFSRRRVE